MAQKHLTEHVQQHVNTHRRPPPETTRQGTHREPERQVVRLAHGARWSG